MLALLRSGVLHRWVSFGVLAVVSVALLAEDSRILRQRAGRLVVWGGNTNMVKTAPSLSNVVAIAPSSCFCLVLLRDGRVTGWGTNTSGVLTVPPTAPLGTALAVGFDHALLLATNRTVFAWGYPWSGVMPPSSLKDAIAIGTGPSYSIALRAKGDVVAWGELDNPTWGPMRVPGGLSNVTAIASGPYHAIALRRDGTVTTWGAGKTTTGVAAEAGQQLVPSDATNIVAIAAGGNFCLALSASGRVIGWGSNISHQLDVFQGVSNVKVVAAGWSHSVGILEDGTVICSGAEASIGKPDMLLGVISVAAGDNYTVAIVAP